MSTLGPNIRDRNSDPMDMELGINWTLCFGTGVGKLFLKGIDSKYLLVFAKQEVQYWI